jgi:hypothetical protein
MFERVGRDNSQRRPAKQLILEGQTGGPRPIVVLPLQMDALTLGHVHAALGATSRRVEAVDTVQPQRKGVVSGGVELQQASEW